MVRHSLHCIVPPKLLEQLLQHKDAAIRAAAQETLLQTAHLRGQRSILGSMYVAPPEGGLHRSIYDAEGHSRTSGKLVRDEGKKPVKDKSVNNVYDGFGATYKLYKDVYGRDSIDGKGLRIVGVVHYAHKYDNAFWNGARMMFGDGDGKLFTGFSKSVDVIGHELTHGVTEFTCNLEYHNQSGALNESVSDVFGSLVKQYKLNQKATEADWLIGAGILGPAIKGKALRSMQAPGTAFDGDDQPASMSGYAKLPDTDAGDYGGVHTNSGIPNHAFYLAATALGGYAWEEAGQVWYDALLHVSADADFKAFATATREAAGQRYGTASKQQMAVANAWDAVGVKVKSHVKHIGPKVGKGGSPLRTRLETIALELHEAAEAI